MDAVALSSQADHPLKTVESNRRLPKGVSSLGGPAESCSASDTTLSPMNPAGADCGPEGARSSGAKDAEECDERRVKQEPTESWGRLRDIVSGGRSEGNSASPIPSPKPQEEGGAPGEDEDDAGGEDPTWRTMVSRLLTRKRLDVDDDDDDDMNVINQSHEAQRHIQAAKRTNGIIADDPWVPFWEITLLMFTLYFEITVTLNDVYDDWSTKTHLPLDIAGACVFTADIGVRAAIHYYSALRSSTAGKQTSGRDGLVVYAKGWLAIDFISAFPFHVIFAVTGSKLGHLVTYHFPLLRLFRGYTYFAQVNPEAMSARYIYIYYKLVPLVQLVFWSVYTLHLFVIVRLALIGDRRFDEDSYITALYYVLYTVTTVGYGDVDVNSRWEKIYAMFLFVFGSIANAVIIGTLSRMMQAHNIKSERKSRMLETLAVMRHFSIPKALQQEVLAFQAHILEHNMGSSYSEIIDGLPRSMQQHIGLYVRIKFVATVEMFKKADQACKRALAEVLQNVVYAPGQYIITAGEVGQEMFFVGHGYADVLTASGEYIATVKKGEFVGEIALLIEGTLRTASIKALTYCDVFRLDKEDFKKVREEFPHFNDLIIVEVQRRKRLQEEQERRRHSDAASHRDCDSQSPAEEKESLELARPQSQPQLQGEDEVLDDDYHPPPERVPSQLLGSNGSGRLTTKRSELSGMALNALRNCDRGATASPIGARRMHSNSSQPSPVDESKPTFPPLPGVPSSTSFQSRSALPPIPVGGAPVTPTSDAQGGEVKSKGDRKRVGIADDRDIRTSSWRAEHDDRRNDSCRSAPGQMQFTAMQKSLSDIHSLVAAMERKMGALEDAAAAKAG